MTTTSRIAPDTAGPVRRSQRALAPDLTRGAMLLFIALANAGNAAFAGGPGFDMTPHGLGRIVNVFLSLFVDARAYPVFALMFGYGLVQLSRRLERESPAASRRVLVRRNAALVGLGLAHATLLYFGDFLGAYGIVGLVATLLLLPRGDRFHRFALWFWVAQLAYVAMFAVIAALTVSSGHARPHNDPNPSLAAPSYAASLVDRLHEWPVHTLTVLPFVIIVWLGIWAARNRLLEDATKVPFLRVVAVVCLSVSVLGAVPYALLTAGWLHVDADSIGALTRLQQVSGMYGGPGYAALLGLVAHRVGARRLPAVEAVAALGRRSLTGYLTQSVVWVVVFSPWALDLGGSGVVAVLVAALTWSGSVAWAVRMERRGDRGPAERVLRRLTYGRASA